ncbi:serine/threonine-protein kinase [Kitasatospora purpeofusca]|uniref:serine/threonine-protein kinase n=1 Tax=Kitasatospora purpeofusca TaxID=67352 RepID=UPI00068D2B64|nr:serine/threonine-protein kinase [Kitasatospora purpeofusca]
MSADRSPFATPPVFQELTPDDPREVGGYRLFARLGAGGMGRVYLSYTPGGRPVALKVVRPELAEDPEFRARFAQEVASARRIHGLFTAQLVDAGVDAATPWLATTYVPGPSLQQVVQRFGPLPERTVLLLIAGIAEALQAIHATGVVHRDLKPGNVLIAPDGPRVIDFGIARAADAGALTSTGLRIGSPAYMAPEQATGRPATPATDVYALGALAVHVATGTPPFGDGPDPATLYRAVHEEPDLDPVPAGLRGLLLGCLAKRPEDRPTTAEVIATVREHPAVAGHLRFGDDWLPHPLTSQITRHAELPQVPAEAAGGFTGTPVGGDPDQALTVLTPRAAAAPTLVAPTLPPGATLTAAALPDPGHGTAADPVGDAAGDPTGGRARAKPRRGRGLGRTALTAAVALTVGAAATVLLLDTPETVEAATAEDQVAATPSPGTPAPTSAPASPPAPATPTPSATPTPGADYAVAYRATELTSADAGYEFDLATGTVVPADSVSWYLGRGENEFLVPETADSYIGRDAALGVAECVKGLSSRPTGRVPFGAVGPRGAFCVRSADGRSLAVVRVLSTAGTEGPVRVSVDHYRRNG